MKKLQASYNDDVNKIVDQALKEKSAIENLNFLINLAVVMNDTKPVPKELKTFNKAWDHPMQILMQNGRKRFKKCLLI